MNQEFKPYKQTESGDYYQHPTFGIMSIARTSCGGDGVSLFGSSILHHNMIRLSISHAELCRDLSHDHVFERNYIVEVEIHRCR